MEEVKGKPTTEPAKLSVKINLSHTAVNRTQERHDYLLTASLINQSAVALGPHLLELIMPSRVLHKPECHHLYVNDRSTRDTAFFRVDSQLEYPKDVIYPGDDKRVISIDYFINHKIYMTRGDLFSAPVRATLYHQGNGPVTVEKPFGNFQNF